MTRKLCAMTLAAAVAGGVYLVAAQPAAASNMGFKLERNFEYVENFRNFFYVSYPLFNGLGDVADSSLTGNVCVGAGGTGDGVINADDAICDTWDGNDGAFTMERYNIDTCSLESRTARIDPFTGAPAFSGEWTDPLPRDEAFQVQQTAPASGTAVNPAVIVGSHDPSYTGRALAPNAACRGDLQIAFLNLPYHTMYQNAIEILCGLEGVDWERDPGSGAPTFPFDVDGDGDVDGDDACAGGIWDGSATLTVDWFDNIADTSGPSGTDTDNSLISCTVQLDPFTMQPAFPDPACYDLIPGEGYIVRMQPSHTSTTFLSPHF